MKPHLSKPGLSLLLSTFLISQTAGDTKQLAPELSEEHGERLVREEVRAADIQPDGGSART